MKERKLSRRDFLLLSGSAAAGTLLAACQPQVIRETVEVEKIVRETVEVEVEKQVQVTPTPAPIEAVAVNFYTTRWASTQDRRPERQVAFRSVIESFNAVYADKGWTVNEVVFEGDDATLTQEMEAGRVDAMWFDFGTYGIRKTAGHLLDMSPVLGAGIDDFFPWVKDTLLSIDGQVGALWHNTDTPLLYYKTDKISDPPETWTQVNEVCQRIRDQEGGNKYALSPVFVGWTQTTSGMFVALGGKYVDESGAPVAFEPAYLDIWKYILQWHIDLLKNDLIPAAAANWDQGGVQTEIFAGNLYGGYENSNFHIRELKPTVSEEEYALWSAVPLPYPDEAQHGIYQAGGWMVGPVALGNPAAAEAAVAWTIHATNPQSMAITNKAGGWIPTRPAVLEADPFYAQDSYAQTTLAALNNGYVIPLAQIYTPMILAIEVGLQRVAANEVDIDQALMDAQAETMREWEALQASG